MSAKTPDQGSNSQLVHNVHLKSVVPIFLSGLLLTGALPPTLGAQQAPVSPVPVPPSPADLTSGPSRPVRENAFRCSLPAFSPASFILN